MSSSVDDLLQKLSGVRPAGDEWMALCPAHEDRNPSLHVGVGDNGAPVLYCFAGCDRERVLGALGLTWDDLYDDAEQRNGKRDVEEYCYIGPDGQVWFTKYRSPDKKFWIEPAKPRGSLPWRLPRLIAAQAGDRVFVVEGERKVWQMEKWFPRDCATCSPFGASFRWPAEWGALFQGKVVIILPDNDAPGMTYARAAEACVRGAAAEVHVIALPDLPAKGDVVDWARSGHQPAELEALIERARHVAPPPEPQVEPYGLGWQYEPTRGVKLRAEKLKEHSDGWKGRITVESMLPGLRKRLYRGRHWLEGSRSTAELIKAVERAGQATGLNWEQYIRTFLDLVIDAEEEGPEFEEYDGEGRDGDDAVWLIDGLLRERQTTVLYGPGGTGKGYLALAMGMCVQAGIPFLDMPAQQGNVLYLDWEDDGAEFNRRVGEIRKGLGLPPTRMKRARCGRSLVDDVAGIAERVDRENIALVIVDSVEAASVSDVERLGWHERATLMGRALRYLRCSHLLIDHVAGSYTEGAGLARGPIGGVMKKNLARQMWEVKHEQERKSSWMDVVLHDTKRDRGAEKDPIAIHVEWADNGASYITRQPYDAGSELIAAGSLLDRIRLFLGSERMTAAEIARAMRVDQESVRNALRRNPETFGCQERKGPQGHLWYVDVSERGLEEDIPF